MFQFPPSRLHASTHFATGLRPGGTGPFPNRDSGRFSLGTFLLAAHGSAATYFEEICAQIASGIPQQDVLASNPEYPSKSALWFYAKKTGQRERFRSRTSTAGRSERHFDAIVAAIGTGLTIDEAIESDPRFPARQSIFRYLRAHPHQQHRFDAALREGKLNRLESAKALRHFDTILDRIRGGATEVEACDGIVAIHNFRFFVSRTPAARKALEEAREERERGPNALNRGVSKKFDEADFQFVLDRIRSQPDTPIQSILDDLPEGMPSRGAIYHRIRDSISFRDRFAEAARNRPKNRTKRVDLFAVVSKHVPKHLDRTARDDIISEIVLAVLTGEIAQDDIAKSVKEFVKRHNKRFSPWEFASLDAQIGDDSDFSLGDMATSKNEVW